MLIEGDMHDIAARLKEIDETYALHYEPLTAKFELRGKDDELLIVFPYERMDARMVEHARKTRRERIARIVEEIERANAEAEARAERAQNNAVEDVLREGADRYYAEKRRQGAP